MVLPYPTSPGSCHTLHPPDPAILYIPQILPYPTSPGSSHTLHPRILPYPTSRGSSHTLHPPDPPIPYIPRILPYPTFPGSSHTLTRILTYTSMCRATIRCWALIRLPCIYITHVILEMIHTFVTTLLKLIKLVQNVKPQKETPALVFYSACYTYIGQLLLDMVRLSIHNYNTASYVHYKNELILNFFAFQIWFSFPSSLWTTLLTTSLHTTQLSEHVTLLSCYLMRTAHACYTFKHKRELHFYL